MTQILQIVEKAWEDFLKYYNERVEKYVKEIKLSNNEEFLYEKARNEYFVCWNEYDLLMHLGRFIYKNLEEKSIDGIEIHLEKKIDEVNFGKQKNKYYYSFAEKLEKLKDRIGNYPKVDLIIAKEADFTVPFLLCGEAKFIHTGRNVIKGIEEDINKLKAIKELDIAKEVALFIFDDYYYYKKGSKIKEIEEKIKEIKEKNEDAKEKEKIIIFEANSKWKNEDEFCKIMKESKT